MTLEEKLNLAYQALELYAMDIKIAHNPVFARNTLLKIYADEQGKDLYVDEQVIMPTFVCKKCKTTFVSIREHPTCPFCGESIGE